MALYYDIYVIFCMEEYSYVSSRVCYCVDYFLSGVAVSQPKAFSLVCTSDIESIDLS